MSRPRKTGADLPARVYQKHGAYFYVTPGGKWLKLCHDARLISDSLAQLQDQMTRDDIAAYARRLLLRAKFRTATRRPISCSLTHDDVLALLEAGGWRCAVTGTPFTLQKIGGRVPFAPSLDRIDCSLGYEPGNCRVVCMATNLAMNTWGEPALLILFNNWSKTRKTLSSIRQSNNPETDPSIHASFRAEKLPSL